MTTMTVTRREKCTKAVKRGKTSLRRLTLVDLGSQRDVGLYQCRRVSDAGSCVSVSRTRGPSVAVIP